jgi:formylglycine-generating enzyme required for sulfatase activity
LAQGASIPVVRVFVSSPGDVAEERGVALGVLRRLQGHFQGRFRLVPILWEQEPLLATAGFQEEIDRRVPPSAADVAVFILWARLGTPLSPAFALDDGRRPTGTEWEFEEATRASRERRTPHVLVYRKRAKALIDATHKAAALAGLAGFEAVEAFFARHFRDPETLSFTGSYHRFEDPAAFGRSLEEHLTKLLAERVSKADAPLATWQGSPFRGLEAFHAEHAPVFFGRTRAIQEVRQALAQQARAGRAFVLILGPSGNGKSSLARAGLLPQLTAPWVIEESVEGGFCRQAIVRPADGSTPLLALAAALTAIRALPDLTTRGGPAALAEALAEGPRSATLLVRGALEREAARVANAQGLAAPPPARLVLLVDQIEEAFTREGVTDTDREAFARVLHALATSGDVWVLATLRSDFYPAFARLEPLMALKEGHGQYDLGPPDATEVSEAVRGPAQAAGLVYEVDAQTGRSLAETLVDEGTRAADALPLLEFLLTLLWEGREEGHRLTLATYKELGGLEGAIATHAERTWEGLGASARTALPAVLRALVEVGDGADLTATRRRAPLAEATTTPGAEAFVNAFTKARLLTAEGDGAGTVVTVAHEALLRVWARLAERLRAEAELLRVRSRLRSAAARWQGQGREASLLLAVGKPLDEARALRTAGFELTALEGDFVRASEARARRLTFVKRAAVAAIALLALVAGWMAFDADRSRRTAEALRDRTLSDSLRVEDLSSLRAILASKQTLFPADEVSVQRAEEQIGQAKETLERLPDHELALAALRARAVGRPAEGAEADPRAWRFAEAPDATAHAVLSELVHEAREMLEGPAGGTAGALAALERRFERATREPPDWGAVIEDIADPARSPAYKGLRIAPQFGLFPLGKDPKSGLHEFAHLYSGKLPARGADKVLHYAPDAAVVFVLIPGGTFWMGAAKDGERNVDPQAAEDEHPHEVPLSAFFIAKHECTQAQWEWLTGGLKPSFHQPESGEAKPGEDTSRRPVEGVSWADITSRTGGVLPFGLALPTEAQWEYACRAETPTRWSSGDDEEALAEHAWYVENSVAQTHLVGEKKPNAWGIHDMHGNVWEWCQDAFGYGFYDNPAATQRDPLNAGTATDRRVYRGGGWGFSAVFLRSADRDGYVPELRSDALGFRVVRPVTAR